MIHGSQRSYDISLLIRNYISQRIIVRYSSNFLSGDNRSIQLNELDTKWTKKWKQLSPTNALHPTKHIVDPDASPFYCLSMFPYPSGMLHMGHLRVYTISDVMARFKRLKGYNVIHPMGWDAFGLPAENAAVERGIDPAIWTESNIAKMKEQMNLMLADFDWEREVTTCSPDYYKWTQKIFTLLFENGLAYRKEAEINWDPIDQTVLANEQVDSDGKSWRSGALVEKKNLEQWFIGITKYAKSLNKDLEDLKDWPDKVKAMQKHWIGESKGAEIIFASNSTDQDQITIFTTRPDTLFSVQFIALSLSHPIVAKAAETDAALRKYIDSSNDASTNFKSGYLLENIKVSLPIDTNNNKHEIFNVPVYAALYVLGSYGSGAVMGCPAHDERDFDFWKLHNPSIPILPTIGHQKTKKEKDATDVIYTSKSGVLYDNSILKNGVSNLGLYNNMPSNKAAYNIIQALKEHGRGNGATQLRLRDWLISRQRYWGAPIPIVHCNTCGPVSVPDDELPVLLPKVERSFFEKGSPLSKVDSFVNTKCPSCGSDAKRDTDTMDTFMDSSWYFFRYTDPKNVLKPFDYKKASENIPVDIYIGGVEHAILHLLYSRFIAKFLSDIGMWNGEDFNNEPIKKLITQGMVHGKTYKDPANERFLKPDELDLNDPVNPKIVQSGVTPLISYEKMSKSKYNGADPAECIRKYGADATRAHMLFQAPVSDILNWNEQQIQGIDRWLKRVIALKDGIVTAYKEKYADSKCPGKCGIKGVDLKNVKYDSTLFNETEFEAYNEILNLIKKISNAIESDLSLNTVISDYMKMTNTIGKLLKEKTFAQPELLLDFYRMLLITMAPVTPAVSEECWEALHESFHNDWRSIFAEKFPSPKLLESSQIRYNVFVNGKARALFKGQKTLINQPESKVIQEALKHGMTQKFLGDSKIKRVIINSGLISIITEKIK